ncbi:hypothetical protein AVEN_254090-1 [Araneus ventricosus]|uniref:Uncharacterized protein n=1 Tax=Araneus ventricosus TaxID=182803 RepID=A0A4Y2BXV8_ARAVE|nr:hypothetical protein AVEN_254090-1 [Araneus ventricosus]
MSEGCKLLVVRNRKQYVGVSCKQLISEQLFLWCPSGLNSIVWQNGSSDVAKLLPYIIFDDRLIFILVRPGTGHWATSPEVWNLCHISEIT